MGHSINNDESLRDQKFNRLTIIGFEKVRRSYGGTTTFSWNWICRCDCGKIVSVVPGDVRSGHVKSCGCLRNEITSERNKITKYRHGGRYSKLYHVWQGMKTRCYNKNNEDYPNWGGRGICVCQEWLNDFASFEKWAIENGYRDGLSLDRINVNGDYCPDNCRFTNWKVQARNKVNAKLIEFHGELRPLAELAEEYGMPYGTVWQRIHNYGWDIERALTEERHTGKHF